MSLDTDCLKTTNDSGFPLQIAVSKALAQGKVQDWSVRYTEHGWSNRFDSKAGFIDLVLQTDDRSIFLVVECKRVREAVWIFIPENGNKNSTSRAKCWRSEVTHGHWEDVNVRPICEDATFCAIRGQSSNDNKVTLLERIGGELIASTEALAEEDINFRVKQPPEFQYYFNVIVTTADIKIANFDPNLISLADGTLDTAEFTDVPYVRFRKQFSHRVLFGTDNSNFDIVKEKENTVFVVQAKYLVSFLKEFEVRT